MKHKNTKGAFGGQRKARSSAALPMSDPLAFVIPDDVKADIAKVVRSVDWRYSFQEGGLCFYRAVTGYTVLKDLGIPAVIALGGMVYRTGPDEVRDVVAFCGPRNAGITINGHFLGHYWVMVNDDIVDFSVGDWQKDITDNRGISDYYPPGAPKLDPIQWTVTDVPEFFWAHKSSFSGSGTTPELGRAWYTGFAGDALTKREFDKMFADTAPTLKECRAGHLRKAYEHYALKERLYAAREGHTAVRLSQLAKIIGDAELLQSCIQSGCDQLIVLRGKQEISKEAALEILSEVGQKLAMS